MSLLSRSRRCPPMDAQSNGDFFYRYCNNNAAAATSSADYYNPTPSRKRRDHHNPATDLFSDPHNPPLPPLKRRRNDYNYNYNYNYVEAEEEGTRTRRRLGGVAETEEAELMSRDEIERCSPSRKDGINLILETHLRYSYCSYLQTLGTSLQLPQTTIGTAIVLCHRFFSRRSHATHDRFLIATAALFLSAKSEETPCLLNTLLRSSCEICQNLNFAYFRYLAYSQDWFEQYRERVVEAEQMILTTLDFELDVQHPYVPLTSVLSKVGLSQTVLFNLAWNLVTEGLRSSLWLQFKPHQIAAGAAFLAAKFLNFDLSCYPSIWHEFRTTPSVLQDVVQQLMELF